MKQVNWRVIRHILVYALACCGCILTRYIPDESYKNVINWFDSNTVNDLTYIVFFYTSIVLVPQIILTIYRIVKKKVVPQNKLLRIHNTYGMFVIIVLITWLYTIINYKRIVVRQQRKQEKKLEKCIKDLYDTNTETTDALRLEKYWRLLINQKLLQEVDNKNEMIDELEQEVNNKNETIDELLQKFREKNQMIQELLQETYNNKIVIKEMMQEIDHKNKMIEELEHSVNNRHDPDALMEELFSKGIMEKLFSKVIQESKTQNKTVAELLQEETQAKMVEYMLQLKTNIEQKASPLEQKASPLDQTQIRFIELCDEYIQKKNSEVR